MRRGGTVSISGVYGGAADPMPMMDLFDKQMQLRMGQCNVKRWIDESCRWSRTTPTRSACWTCPPTRCRSGEAPEAYKTFQEKTDGCIKVVLKP